MGRRVLVTGFEPFGNHIENISQIVATSLDGEKIRGHTIDSLILKVSQDGARTVSKLLETKNYAAIVHIGLAESAKFPRIELLARDLLDFSIPDNSGRFVKNQTISGDGDRESTIFIQDWDVKNMIDKPEISYDAGSFICNETLYNTLGVISKETPCVFLHLPKVQDDARGFTIQCIDRMLRPRCVDVGAGAIISNRKFLAARRSKNEKHAGWWEFPGGKFEEGEDANQCLIREIFEELELVVSTGEKIGNWIYDHGDIVVRLHVVECFIESGDIKLHVHDKIHWCEGPDEVDWLGPDREIAEAISARL